MRHLCVLSVFFLLPMLSAAQQQNEEKVETKIPMTAKYGLQYAVAPDFNLPPKAKVELPFFCALEKKIALTIKSDVKLGIEPCEPVPRFPIEQKPTENQISLPKPTH